MVTGRMLVTVTGIVTVTDRLSLDHRLRVRLVHRDRHRDVADARDGDGALVHDGSLVRDHIRLGLDLRRRDEAGLRDGRRLPVHGDDAVSDDRHELDPSRRRDETRVVAGLERRLRAEDDAANHRHALDDRLAVLPHRHRLLRRRLVGQGVGCVCAGPRQVVGGEEPAAEKRSRHKRTEHQLRTQRHAVVPVPAPKLGVAPVPPNHLPRVPLPRCAETVTIWAIRRSGERIRAAGSESARPGRSGSGGGDRPEQAVHAVLRSRPATHAAPR